MTPFIHVLTDCSYPNDLKIKVIFYWCLRHDAQLRITNDKASQAFNKGL